MPTTSANMGLAIPVFGDPSPGYATNVSAALSLIDAHDHSTGKGALITPSGLNINSDLNVGSNNVTSLRSARYASQSAVFAAGADINCVYVKGGDLYFRDASSNNVRITSSGALNAAAVGGFGGDYVTAAASANYVDATKFYEFYQAGGSTLCDVKTSSLYISKATPGVRWVDSTVGERAFRAGSDASEWHLSIDSAGTGTVNSSGHFTDAPNALVLKTVSSQSALGIGVVPSNGALEVNSPAGGLAWVGFFNGTPGGTTGTGGLLIKGGRGTADPRSTILTLFDANIRWDLGILSTTGASSLSATAGDFNVACISGGTINNVLSFRGLNQNVGVNCAQAQSKFDVAGSVSIGSYGGVTAAPSNGLIVSGNTCIGTSATVGGAVLTLGGAIFPASTYNLGGSSNRWGTVYTTNADVSTSLVLGGTVGSSVVPTTNNTYSLGTSSSAEWLGVWGSKVYATAAVFTPTTYADVVARHRDNSVIACGNFSNTGVAGATNWNCTANATHVGTGHFTVTLNVGIAGGAVLVTPGSNAARFATIIITSATAIEVYLWDNTGAAADVAFYFAILGGPFSAP